MQGSAGVTGENNTGIGKSSLHDVTSGHNNVAIGQNTAKLLTTGIYNVAIGNAALESITTVSYCTAVGYRAARYSTAGSNTAFGALALENQTGGDNNVALGYSTMGSNNNFSGSTAVGALAGQLNSGNYNTFLGYYSGNNVTSGSNNTVIGRSATASSATVSNEITLGNSSIATLRCQVHTISSLSDARDKTDITPLQAGLGFVERLDPVSFTWNMRDGGKVGIEETGFIAQDLQQVQQDTGVEIPGLVNDENPERLEAAYGKLVPVLVQAIKDLSAKVNELEAQINS